MRLTSATAALLASAVLAGAVAAPASAHTRTGPSPARAVWIKACGGNPCGHWRLKLRDGRTITVPDAAATEVDARGRRTTDTGVFAVSGDGRTVLYERAPITAWSSARSRAAPAPRCPARWRPGAPPRSPCSCHPRGPGAGRPRGRAQDGVPTKVFTVGTGRTTELPGHGQTARLQRRRRRGADPARRRRQHRHPGRAPARRHLDQAHAAPGRGESRRHDAGRRRQDGRRDHLG